HLRIATASDRLVPFAAAVLRNKRNSLATEPRCHPNAAFRDPAIHETAPKKSCQTRFMTSLRGL
ncbi:hypothetical protein, partial [Enterobacter hormaechei]|uniref:hypothetical protein n=1 Tax=Enterobacter hormaechei TaxID=158836 RepID=UPI001953121E